LSSPRDDTERLDRLVDELRLTPVLTPFLISRVVADACTRVASMARAGRAARLDRMVRAEAWLDAVLCLIDLELPMWRPRRLIYDGGEWVCSLSCHPEIPLEIDDTADGQHEAPPVAILLSLVEAKRLLATSERVSVASVPRVAPEPPAYIFCCDNFR
jgi:hypothetical protein